MRILIADDHDLVREMMAAYLERDGGMQVIQCASFEEAMGEMVRNGPFELVLLDFIGGGPLDLPRLVGAPVEVDSVGVCRENQQAGIELPGQ